MKELTEAFAQNEYNVYHTHKS